MRVYMQTQNSLNVLSITHGTRTILVMVLLHWSGVMLSIVFSFDCIVIFSHCFAERSNIKEKGSLSAAVIKYHGKKKPT